jgi:hypothetical protein
MGAAAPGGKVRTRVHHFLIGLRGGVVVAQLHLRIADNAERRGRVRVEGESFFRPQHADGELMPSAIDPGETAVRFDAAGIEVQCAKVSGLSVIVE